MSGDLKREKVHEKPESKVLSGDLKREKVHEKPESKVLSGDLKREKVHEKPESKVLSGDLKREKVHEKPESKVLSGDLKREKVNNNMKYDKLIDLEELKPITSDPSLNMKDAIKEKKDKLQNTQPIKKNIFTKTIKFFTSPFNEHNLNNAEEKPPLEEPLKENMDEIEEDIQENFNVLTTVGDNNEYGQLKVLNAIELMPIKHKNKTLLDEEDNLDYYKHEL